MNDTASHSGREFFSWRFVGRMFQKFDVAFIGGRFLPLVPVFIASKHIHDVSVLNYVLKQYQNGLFFSTIVLFAAPSIYLVKLGKESFVFAFHMLITTAILTLLFGVLQIFDRDFAIMPLLFFVFFRSVYLYCATRFRTQPGYLAVMLASACASLGVLALTDSLILATIVMLPIYLKILFENGVLKKVYALVAVRKYISIFTRNIFYYLNVLLAQAYTQVFLVIFAFFASGKPYVTALHAVYLYFGVVIFHQILVRTTITSAARLLTARKATTPLIARLLLVSEIRSVGLGIAGVLALALFWSPVERLAFGSTLLTNAEVALISAMVLLQAYYIPWSGLIVAARRARLLFWVTSSGVTTMIAALVAFEFLRVPYGYLWAQVLALFVQCTLATIGGIPIIRNVEQLRPD